MPIKSFPSLESLSAAAAKEIAILAKEAIEERGQFTIALSGGNTPRSLYELLARDYSTSIDWKRVHLFWGDERFVPLKDPASNFRMAREALQDGIDIPAENIHPIPTAMSDPLDSALGYSVELFQFFKGETPEFDIVLLGLGNDGHTASLFPGMYEKEMNRGDVIVTRSPVIPFDRISLTLSVINNARNVFFLVAGSDKAGILHEVLEDAKNEKPKFPAAMVKPVGNLLWFVDEAANS